MTDHFRFLTFPSASVDLLNSVNLDAGTFVLNARRMTTLSELYDEFARELQFPDYFGRNLDALADLLTDLDWLSFEHLTLIILNSGDLLSAEAPHVHATMLQLLDSVGEGWSKPVTGQGEWDRGPIEYRVLLI